MKDKIRRVFYCDKELYRQVKLASAMVDETISDFVNAAIRHRIGTEFTEDQRSQLFNS